MMLVANGQVKQFHVSGCKVSNRLVIVLILRNNRELGCKELVLSRVLI